MRARARESIWLEVRFASGARARVTTRSLSLPRQRQRDGQQTVATRSSRAHHQYLEKEDGPHVIAAAMAASSQRSRVTGWRRRVQAAQMISGGEGTMWGVLGSMLSRRPLPNQGHGLRTVLPALPNQGRGLRSTLPARMANVQAAPPKAVQVFRCRPNALANLLWM